MHDQADQLRRLVREVVDLRGELAPGAPLVVVSGAQPRLGTTTIACGLARELARLGKQVAVVDANLAAPAVAAAFAVEPYGTLADVLAGRRRAIEALTPAADNIHILAGAAQPAEASLGADACERLATELLAVTRRCEVTLIDAGAGMTPWVDRLWQLATQILLTTTPTAPAAVDAYAALKLSHHERAAAKLQLVVTQCDHAADAARIHAGLDATCQRFLGRELKPPAVLPLLAKADDAAFQRSLRLLAADIACDGRALTSRLPRRTSPARLDPTLAPGASRGLEAQSTPPLTPSLRWGLLPD